MTGLNPSACPKCGAVVHGTPTCPACGLIFEKYARAQARKRLAEEQKALKGPERRHAPFGLTQMNAWAKFFRRLGKLQDAGLALPQAVKEAGAGTKVTGPIVARAMPHLDRGDGLVRSLAHAGTGLPSYAWGHLEAGELTGRLPENLVTLAEDIEARRKRILAQIFNWRTLWFFLLLSLAAFSLAVSGGVANLPEDRLGSISSVLIGVLIRAVPRFIIFGGLFAGVVIVFIWFQIKGKALLTQRSPDFERIRLSLPFFSDILKAETLARAFSLLADLLEAGLPLPRAIDLTAADIEFPQWRAAFTKARDRIETGASLTDALAGVPAVPPELLSEIRVGEHTGAVADGLRHFAQDARERVSRMRTTLGVIQAAALMGLSVLITVLVIIRGVMAQISLYDKI